MFSLTHPLSGTALWQPLMSNVREIMENQIFMVTLTVETPKEFLACLSGYLNEWNGVHHFFSHEIEPSLPFVRILAISNDKTSQPHPVYIPTGFVLSIASSPEDKHSAGFHLNSQ